VHPAIVELGLRYADGTLRGGNARCVALLHALVAVIRDYTTPEGKSLARDLTAHINATIAFLVECRPLSVSMGARLPGWAGWLAELAGGGWARCM
jgi:translation initiation factor eIF-2B subunit delta